MAKAGRPATPEDRAAIEHRRRYVEMFYMEQGMTMAGVVDALKKLQPPIECSMKSVERDIFQLRKAIRLKLSAKFDPVTYVAETVRAYQSRAHRLEKSAAETKDYNEQATLLRAANDCTKLATELLQDAGLVDKRIGAMLIFQAGRDVGSERAERRLSGEEIRRLAAESQQIIEGSLVSEGEREMLAEQNTEGGDPV